MAGTHRDGASVIDPRDLHRLRMKQAFHDAELSVVVVPPAPYRAVALPRAGEGCFVGATPKDDAMPSDLHDVVQSTDTGVLRWYPFVRWHPLALRARHRAILEQGARTGEVRDVIEPGLLYELGITLHWLHVPPAPDARVLLDEAISIHLSELSVQAA
jgi:hypothetical protein